MHLAGSKKVQQKLAEPGVLEKFMPDSAAQMRKVFADLYSLDGDEGTEAIQLALANPAGYVLKPQREGGGNNLYSDQLKARLEQGGDLGAFILMQRILPPSHSTLTIRNGNALRLETLSELGIYGSYLRVGDDVVVNKHGGHLLRTKAATSDEGGVAAGYAVLDSPKLV
jgi:glutathione synthetase